MSKNGLRWLMIVSLALGYFLGRRASAPKTGPAR